MKTRAFLFLMILLACAATTAAAQNNCAASPPTGTCLAPPPIQLWCAGNNPGSTCPGGTSWVGFTTSPPAAGSWFRQFEGLDAVGILQAPGLPKPQPDPNGGVGPTDGKGVGQYLEFASNYIQAFDRATGNGILSTKPNGGATPQPFTRLFSPGGKSYCTNGSVDGIATYDRIDGVFVLGNIFNPGGGDSYHYCIGVSAASGSVPASNLQGANGQSHWNVYAYDLRPAIPLSPSGHLFFPDYQRFGTWADGFYVAWDLEDINRNFSIVGFEVCKFDKANIIAGLTSNPPVCYTYIPGYVYGTNGTGNTLIHTLLPADFEGANPVPPNSAGEYFLAQVNPSDPGSNRQCSAAPCTSAQLAFWTWSGFVSGAGPTYITFPNNPYTPGCYNPQHPYNTFCVPEPYGGVIDSLGDRLNYRLAYRNLTQGEFLAVTHTVQENATSRRTGIRYYLITAGANPSIAFLGDIQDTTYRLFLSMPSVAMDMNGDLGVTFTVTGSKSRGSATDYDPSPFFLTVNSGGKLGQPVAILSNSGASGQDETDDFWGEYVSVSADPNDDLTFWALNQYMNGDQIGNCNRKTGTGCTWATRVYTCKKGSGC